MSESNFEVTSVGGQCGFATRYSAAPEVGKHSGEEIRRRRSIYWINIVLEMTECYRARQLHDVLEENQQYALIVPLLYSTCWLLHVSAVACHHQGAIESC
jgi:hypothetical protein